MVKLYAEGGGEAKSLKIEFRQGLHTFLKKAGIKKQPGIVACGTRRNAYEQFCFALAAGNSALLLVDSEDPIAPEHRKGEPKCWHPWAHLKSRLGDRWDKPAGAEERHCHLMVHCMESWFLADPDTLARFFGQGFASGALPKAADVESVDKAAVYAGLASATRGCRTKGRYGKGEHSFKLLASVDPALVGAASPWARRFLDEMQRAP